MNNTIVQAIFDIAVLVLLWCAGVHDVKTRMVKPSVQWTFLGLGLAHVAFLFATEEGLYAPLNCLFTGLGVMLFYLLLVFIFETGIGGGDTKMTALLGLYLGWEQGFAVVIAHCLAAFVYVGAMKLFKKKHIASVPAMLYMAIAYTLVKGASWTMYLINSL